MSNDIVARLRAWVLCYRSDSDVAVDMAASADEIEDLMFRLEGTIGELDNALSRERTLLSEQEDCRIGSDNLHAEIDRLREELNTRIAMCDMRSEKIIELTNELKQLCLRVKELEGLIDSAMEADYNNKYFKTHHK